VPVGRAGKYMVKIGDKVVEVSKSAYNKIRKSIKEYDPHTMRPGHVGNVKYSPTKKHKQGGWGTTMDLDDKTAQKVLEESVQNGKQRYGLHNGKVYEFQPDNSGGYHGYPVGGSKAGSKVLRQWLNEGKINKSQYKKLLKQSKE
jgi:hypothetical protein